jgi:hypothetical protein
MIRTARSWNSVIPFAVGLVAVALPPPLRSEQVSAAPMPVQDTTVAFCYILKYLQLSPLQSNKQLDNAPERTLLVVFGKTEVLNNIPGGLSNFLDRGGAVLVATDQNSSRTTKTLGITVHGAAVLAPRGAGYRNEENCPLLTGEDFDEGLPPFREVKRIATNRPSYLGRVPEISVVARFPPTCFAPPSAPLRDHPLPFAALLDRQGGRVLALADHSIFIDEMMLQKDNDNFNFAFNCVQWLAAPEGRRSPRRDRILFVYDGEIITDFGPPLPELPDPPIPPLHVAGNRILTELESKNIFNRLILDQVSLERVLQVLFVVLSLGLVAYGLARLRRARHRPEPAAPLAVRGMPLRSPFLSVVAQRHQALVAEGNVWEAARALARQFFDSAAGLRPQGPSPGAPYHGRVAAAVGAPPQVVLSGDGRGDRPLADQVRHLWHLAYDAVPTRVSPRQLEEIIAQLDAVKAALRRGTLRLEPAGVS